MPQASDVSTGAWDNFAVDYGKRMATGPAVAVNRALLSCLDAASPLSSATAFLDIGCGSGIGVSQLVEDFGHKLAPTARIIASDTSEGMVAQVRAQKDEGLRADTPASKLWARVEPAGYDALDLSPLGAGSLSHIMAALLVFLVPDPRKSLVEMHRALAAGGVLALSSWGHLEWRDLMLLVNNVRPEKKIPNIPEAWQTIEGVRAELEATGYVDIDLHTIPTYFDFDDPEELCRFLLLKFPLMAMTTKDMDSEELGMVLEIMISTVKKDHPKLPARLEGTAIVGSARKPQE